MVDFHVTFDPKPRVAGEVVEGEVLLNIPVLELRNYHEVHAECSCIVLTYVPYSFAPPLSVDFLPLLRIGK